MAKFKLKLNQNEIKLLAWCCMYAPGQAGKANGARDLAEQETCMKLAEKMLGMYRIDKPNYSLRLNTMETYLLATLIVPRLQNSDNPLCRCVGYLIAEDLGRQVIRELEVFNAMHHGDK